MSITRIILVDDHPAIAYGTKMIIEQNLNYQVVEVLTKVEDVVDTVLRVQPQIMFVDMQMPGMNGKELTTIVKKLSPRTQIVVFSGFDLFPMWNQLLQSGASGILSKNASPSQIMRMIGAILDGETVVPLTLASRLVYNENPQLLLQNIELSEREQSIMRLVCDGGSNADIAQRLNVSTRTAENYLSKIYEKLGVRLRKDAIETFKSRY